MSRRTRLALMSLIAGGVALAGCSSQPTATTTTTTSTTAGRSHAGGSTTASPRAGGTVAPRSKATSAPASSSVTTGQAGGNTGIPACDDYLASYVACHRTAAIYPQDQIEGHYEAMRDSLLRDSQDPNTRPQLAGRCTALAQTLRQALHGRSCGPVNPAAPSSSSGKSP